MSTKRFPGALTLAAYVFAVAWLLMLAGCSGDNSSNPGSDGGSLDATADNNVHIDSGSKDSTTPDGTSCPTGQASCAGKCVTLSSDPANCGVCGSTCGTGLVCSNGTCALSCGDSGTLTQCGSGCYDLQTDSNNCGTCGTTCTGGQACIGGSCKESCGSGSTLCGTQCVDTQADNLNCGACNAPCVAGTVCSAGVCKVNCGGGLTQCSADGGSVCKDLTSDGNNCGSCGNTCAVGTVCSMGSCTGSCTSPLIDCAGGCINPQTSPQYCGASGACGQGDSGSPGTNCASGLNCVNGACTVVCSPGQITCGGTCIDPTSNNTYCGASGPSCTGGIACTAGTVCTGGVCKANCNPGQVICGGSCVDPKTNLTYCGATVGSNCLGANAGTTCPPGNVCTGGTCQITCGLGLVACNGSCIDPTSNLNYCGASANCASGDQGVDCTQPPFGGGYICNAGSCALSCQTGYVDCNSKCVNPQNDPVYCGAGPNCSPVGQTCPAGNVCSGGHCVLSCQTGEAECSPGGVQQCVDPATDATFCGAAGYAGPGTGQCNKASPKTDPNYEGVNCASSFAAGSTCSNGACVCPGSQVVCMVGTTPTCIDPATSNAFCGANSACGSYSNCASTAGSSCQGGSCLCPVGSGDVICTVGTTPTCIDPTTDNEYCGASGNCKAPNAGENCTGIAGANCGVVAPATTGTCNCAGGDVNCNVGGAATCIDPHSSLTNCGATQQCGAGGFGVPGENCTQAPYGNGYLCTNNSGTYTCQLACPTGEINCNGTCVVPGTNLNFCGSSGNCQGANAGHDCTQPPYGSGYVCNAGTCSISCPGNEINCNSSCISPSTDPKYCGATGNCQGGNIGTDCTQAPYGPGYQCVTGTCQLTCPTGTIACGTTCINPGTSITNCGASGNCTGGNSGKNCGNPPYGAGYVCNSGNCSLSCPGSLINCGGTCIDPNSNPTHCGATGQCGNPGGTSGQTCGVGYACVSAACEQLTDPCVNNGGTHVVINSNIRICNNTVAWGAWNPASLPSPWQVCTDAQWSAYAPSSLLQSFGYNCNSYPTDCAIWINNNGDGCFGGSYHHEVWYSYPMNDVACYEDVACNTCNFPNSYALDFAVCQP